MAATAVPLDKNVDLKCMQVNTLKFVTRMAKRDGGIRSG